MHRPCRTAYFLIPPCQTAFWAVDSMLKANANLVYTGKTVTGKASYYSTRFDGIKTSTGERFSSKSFTGASNNLPLGTWVKVTNLHNGKMGKLYELMIKCTPE